MERFLSDQPSTAVINYSSSSYGGFLFRSPNSPPPPSLSPPPSIASQSHLSLGARFNHRSRSPVYGSSPAGFFQQPQPPLLPLPRSATLSAPIPSASVRSRRNDRRKGKVFPRSGKETSPPLTMVKEERKPAIATKEVVKYESQPSPQEEKMESVYSLSPPPSSLPFPTFSQTKSKDNRNGGDGAVYAYCIIS